MAAFPPPSLRLHFPPPLLDLFWYCHLGINDQLHLFERWEQRAAEWVKETAPDLLLMALGQLEEALTAARQHRGPIYGETRPFATYWQTPYDCLAEFTRWRRAIAEAVSQLPEPHLFSPAWLTEPVVGLSAAIAAERAFDRLPILADALEEAGCDNPMMLAHLRANDDHAHHCWVVDVLRVGGRAEL